MSTFVNSRLSRLSRLSTRVDSVFQYVIVGSTPDSQSSTRLLSVGTCVMPCRPKSKIVVSTCSRFSIVVSCRLRSVLHSRVQSTPPRWDVFFWIVDQWYSTQRGAEGRRRRRPKKAPVGIFFVFNHYVTSLKRDLCLHWTLLTFQDAFLDVEKNTRFQYKI